MKRFLLALICLIIISFAQLKALNIDSLFINTPRHIMPLLDQTAKMDLVDLYNSGLKARVVNLYSGETVLQKKTTDFLQLKTTESGSWTLKVLPLNNGDSLILCVHSVQAVGTSSNVEAFNPDWTMRKLVIPAPQKEAFIQLPQSYIPASLQPLVSSLLTLPVEVLVNDSTQELTYRLSTTGLNADDLKKCQDWLIPVVYMWNGNAFILKEN